MPKPIGRLIICIGCGKRALHHAHGYCEACYTHQFRIQYFANYRNRPEYKAQRLEIDIRYQLTHSITPKD